MQRIPSGDIFPTDEPIQPGHLIGREGQIAELVGALAGNTNVVVAGPRRTGKTSVCEAALARLSEQGFYTASIDLFKIADTAELAEALVAKLVANRPQLKQLLHTVRATGREIANAVGIKTLVKAQGELGEALEIAFTPGIAARDPHRYLTYALDLPQSIAKADKKRVVVFFDEFQEISSLGDDGESAGKLTKRMRASFQRAHNVSFLFAGSVEHLLRDLFVPREQGLGQFGGFFELGTISPDAWEAGLAAHFAEDKCVIDTHSLQRIIELGEGHPRTTMLIAQQTHAAAVTDGVRKIGLELIEVGFRFAMRVEKMKHQATLERIRHLSSPAVNRIALKTARRIAHGESIYQGAPSSTVKRAVDALHDAGIIERENGGWQVFDPLLRRYISSF